MVMNGRTRKKITTLKKQKSIPPGNFVHHGWMVATIQLNLDCNSNISHQIGKIILKPEWFRTFCQENYDHDPESQFPGKFIGPAFIGFAGKVSAEAGGETMAIQRVLKHVTTVAPPISKAQKAWKNIS